MTPSALSNETPKPCPFCSGTDLALREHHAAPGQITTGEPYSFGCDICGAESGTSATEEAAIAAWNRRSPALITELLSYRSEGDRETGWLIELKGSTPTWYQLSDGDNWTNDSIAALRFGRKIDAERYIEDTGWTEAFASEHEWVPSPRHEWWEWHGMTCCKQCGIVRRSDGGNDLAVCKGHVSVGLRTPRSPSTERGETIEEVIRHIDALATEKRRAAIAGDDPGLYEQAVGWNSALVAIRALNPSGSGERS